MTKTERVAAVAAPLRGIYNAEHAAERAANLCAALVGCHEWHPSDARGIWPELYQLMTNGPCTGTANTKLLATQDALRIALCFHFKSNLAVFAVLKLMGAA